MAPPVSRQRQLAALGWGGVLAFAVCLPLFGSGALWLLDWVPGPHTRLVPLEAFGLNGGLTAGLPFTLSVDEVIRTVGYVGSWLPLFIVFPLGTWGIQRLVGGPIERWLGAATLYCINPFVFQRIYVGHFGLLLGYALLPIATLSARHLVSSSPQDDRIAGHARTVASPALWWASLTALSPHFAWIYGVVLGSVWLTHRPFRLETVWRVFVVVALFAAMSLYIALPHTATQLQVTTRTNSDLALYRTSGDAHFGLIGNVLALYGFWRVGPELPKDVFTGWPFLLLAIFVVAGIGVLQQFRASTESGAKSRNQAGGCRGAAAILLSGTLGYLLALGDQGPTGAPFRWAYFHVPFFAIMREPEKFLMLTVLAYAVFFGRGVEQLAGASRRVDLDMRMGFTTVLALLLPLAYTPTILDGLAGQILPSQLPSSWATADRAMGNGPGLILFVPWHQYLGFPFTGERVIANPAPTSFRRNVISGDNVEAGGIESTSTSPRSTYLQHLYSEGPVLRDFGSLVAPLGVEYVVLSKTVDWRNYFWLDRQSDLVPVMDSGGLQVWRNSAYTGVGQASQPRPIRQISPVAYSIGPGPAAEVTLDAVYQKGWQLGTQKAQETPQGTISFKVGPTGGVVRFTPWGITRLGYVISGAAFVALSGVVVGDRLWRGGRNQRRKRRNTNHEDGVPSPAR